ncbi:uncharacterized protein LOC143253352 isoform X4 [Tachypleus tridentatus]|uniref:uncharacterized protein LOC143253352 isoform X4 n=1 Tax=Tachypleus tridentatus TaxID=6853 RepID=UPI003FD1AA0A
MISYKTLSQLVAPILQLLFVVGCVAGFIFQVVEFVQFYYEYSTTVEIKIEPVKEITFPTVAFCSNSRMNFSHWCVIRPNDCVTNLTSVRDVIKWNHYINSLTVAEMKEAGFQLDKSLVYCSVMGYYGCDPLYKSYTSVYGNCLTINNDWLPHAVIGNRYADESFIRMQFYLYVETNVTFPLNNGVVVAFSSPGSVPDIVNEVYSLEFGKMHVFSLSQSISHLLPPPYATNCTDYEKMGKASFRGGLLTKQSAEQNLLSQRQLTHDTIVKAYVVFPAENINDVIQTCFKESSFFGTVKRICCKGFAYYSQQRGYDLPTPSKISGFRAVQLHWWISWNMAWYLIGKHIGCDH